jgi:hypothetical protein
LLDLEEHGPRSSRLERQHLLAYVRDAEQADLSLLITFLFYTEWFKSKWLPNDYEWMRADGALISLNEWKKLARVAIRRLANESTLQRPLTECTLNTFVQYTLTPDWSTEYTRHRGYVLHAWGTRFPDQPSLLTTDHQAMTLLSELRQWWAKRLVGTWHRLAQNPATQAHSDAGMALGGLLLWPEIDDTTWSHLFDQWTTWASAQDWSWPTRFRTALNRTDSNAVRFMEADYERSPFSVFKIHLPDALIPCETLFKQAARQGLHNPLWTRRLTTWLQWLLDHQPKLFEAQADNLASHAFKALHDTVHTTNPLNEQTPPSPRLLRVSTWLSSTMVMFQGTQMNDDQRARHRLVPFDESPEAWLWQNVDQWLPSSTPPETLFYFGLPGTDPSMHPNLKVYSCHDQGVVLIRKDRPGPRLWEQAWRIRVAPRQLGESWEQALEAQAPLTLSMASSSRF